MSARLKKGMERVNDFLAFASILAMDTPVRILDGPARLVLSQSSILAQTYVELPQLMRLAEQLDWQFMPLTVQVFIDHLMALAKRPVGPENRPQ
jgi:hypothetical protein